MTQDIAEHELRNWSRWCNAGMLSMFMPWGIPAEVLFPEGDAPQPIHEENAKRVQRIFDAAVLMERKVLQAEYLSPWKYGRNKGVQAAASKLELSAPAYETILASVKNRVVRAFQ